MLGGLIVVDVVVAFIVELVAGVLEFIFDLACAFFRPSRPKRFRPEDSKHAGVAERGEAARKVSEGERGDLVS
jgi:hypothetical protein